MGAHLADCLARLHEEAFVFSELQQAPDDLFQCFGIACGLPRAAVDDEFVGVLGHFGVEVVEQHAQGRFGLPGAGVQLCARRRFVMRVIGVFFNKFRILHDLRF